MAINKQAIVDAVFQGAATPAKNPIPPTMWSYNNAIEDDTYDPEAAKKMLEEAGVKDLSMKVWAMPVARPYMLERAPRRRADPGRLRQGRRQGRDRLLRMGRISRARPRPRIATAPSSLGWTGDNGDPDNFLDTLLGCDCRRRQQPRPVVQQGVRRRWSTRPRPLSDQAERTKLYEQAQVVFKEQAPWATLAHSRCSCRCSKNVTGFVQEPLGIHRFDGVDIAE